MATGFYARVNGANVDIDTLFKGLTGTPRAATGFRVAGGADICTLFEPSVSEVDRILFDTQLRISGGTDLTDLFQDKDFNGLPVFTVQPSSGTHNDGAAVTLTVTVVGSPTLTYQWFKDGVAITASTDFTNKFSGFTTTTLTFNAQPNDNNATFHCEATNLLGTVSSTHAYLNVLFAPIIVSEPSDVSTTAGTTFTLTVYAAANPAPAYDWQKYDSNLPGWVSVGDNGLLYWTKVNPPVMELDVRCVLSNTQGSATTRTAHVSVV